MVGHPLFSRAGFALAGLGLAIIFAGCQPKNTFVPPPPPQVTAVNPTREPVTEYMDFTGTTQATAAVELRSRVNGYLREILFKDGAMVQAGELLFVIDRDPFEAQYQSAKASLQKAQKSLELAEANLQRARSLAPQRVVSQQELDIRIAERGTALADVDVAAAVVREAELNLSYTEIRSPISGRIGRHLIDLGALVQAEQTILAKVESIDPIHAYFYVSDRDLLRLPGVANNNGMVNGRGEQVYLGLSDQSDFPYVGYVDYREPSVDAQTGTVMRRGLFSNPDQKILPGQFVRIRVPLGVTEPKLLVDERALGTDQQGDFVLLLRNDDTVEKRQVKLGQKQDNKRVVDGIAASDWVIVEGVQRARPDAKVTAKRQGLASSEGIAPADSPRESTSTSRLARESISPHTAAE